MCTHTRSYNLNKTMLRLFRKSEGISVSTELYDGAELKTRRTVLYQWTNDMRICCVQYKCHAHKKKRLNFLLWLHPILKSLQVLCLKSFTDEATITAAWNFHSMLLRRRNLTNHRYKADANFFPAIHDFSAHQQRNVNCSYLRIL